MKTSVDTNILSAILSGEPNAGALVELLTELQQDGPLVISAPVWTELAAVPGLKPSSLEEMLAEARIEVDFDLPRAVWEQASQAYAAYAQRRRESGAPPPRRLLADFLIGAHAAQATGRLVTANQRFYQALFPSLKLPTPPPPMQSGGKS